MQIIGMPKNTPKCNRQIVNRSGTKKSWVSNAPLPKPIENQEYMVKRYTSSIVSSWVYNKQDVEDMPVQIQRCTTAQANKSPERRKKKNIQASKIMPLKSSPVSDYHRRSPDQTSSACDLQSHRARSSVRSGLPGSGKSRDSAACWSRGQNPTRGKSWKAKGAIRSRQSGWGVPKLGFPYHCDCHTSCCSMAAEDEQTDSGDQSHQRLVVNWRWAREAARLHQKNGMRRCFVRVLHQSCQSPLEKSRQ